MRGVFTCSFGVDDLEFCGDKRNAELRNLGIKTVGLGEE